MCPQGIALTGVSEFHRKSLHTGQSLSMAETPPSPSSPLLPPRPQSCGPMVSETHELHCMQWKKSFPSPLPRRHTLQNGQWYASSASSQKLHTEQKYLAGATPHPRHVADDG